MPAELEAKEREDELGRRPHTGNGALEESSDNGSGQEEEDEEEDEPRLKYTKLTGSLASAYRNGDSTSCFLASGDKMIIGTHNGNVHTFGCPGFQAIRLYHAHSASITALSVSPVLPTPPAGVVNSAFTKITTEPPTATKSPPGKSGLNAAPRTPKKSAVANIPSNQIFIASASIDGHVCVSSLVDQSDVTLRNFARPVQAVALSPDYKNDRTYISAGSAGNLILTVGGRAGHTEDANTNSAAAAASGWLGSIGLGSNTGKDRILHSGEGAINSIKFSRTGKFVVWVNEHGIKIMRSHLKLESADIDHAWKRIAHVDRPKSGAWEDMAGVWKPRVEWISDKNLESDDTFATVGNGDTSADASKGTPQRKKQPEKLVVGWGDTAWILHVHTGGAGVGKHVGERSVGNADRVHKFTFDDCFISGLSLYTPSLLAVLAYRTRDDDDNPIDTTPKRRRRQNGLRPELRLISVLSGEEVDGDELPVTRFESLSAADYHLGTMYVPPAPQAEVPQKGAFESLGAGFWDVSNNATKIFSSGASMSSAAQSGDNGRAPVRSPAGSASNARGITNSRPPTDLEQRASDSGLKFYIQTPYDCVLAVKRDLSDHLNWLTENKKYETAWSLIDQRPEVVSSSDRRSDSSASTPSRTQGSLADFFADENASSTTVSAGRSQNSAAAKEKRRIGDLWLQKLVSANDWKGAGLVAGKVLGTSSRWEHWVLAFAQNDHFDEITPYIPSTDLKPPLPSHVYEVVLGHYIDHDRQRFAELLEKWDPEIFDITSVITALESKLDSGEFGPDTTEDGETGRDWRVLLGGLAKLKLAAGYPREALRCYIRLQNADAAMSLISDYHLVEALSEDIPGFLLLRVSKDQLEAGKTAELEDASSEAISLLVDEARAGVVHSDTVVNQLRKAGKSYEPFLFFYLRSLWNGPVVDTDRIVSKVERLNNERTTSEGRAIVEQYADLAISLFASYDRILFMSFLRNSIAYNLDTASSTCESKDFIPELVYLLGKTGQTKRALFLIIGKLGDVSQAIQFAKENPDLWDDLLDYSMDKPAFIRALLSEVGTAINPIQLIRRIPDGLEIEGLKEGIQRMVREYDIQYSISEGVARVFRGEVSSGMDTLRAGQKRGVKFEVKHRGSEEVEIKINPVANQIGVEDGSEKANKIGLSRDRVKREPGHTKPGHCVGCGELFEEPEQDFLVGFACGHVNHLTCLLDSIDASKSDYRLVEDLQAQSAADEHGAAVWSRSVGAKIAHAQVIRSAVKGGCPVCVAVVGAE